MRGCHEGKLQQEEEKEEEGMKERSKGGPFMLTFFALFPSPHPPQ